MPETDGENAGGRRARPWAWLMVFTVAMTARIAYLHQIEGLINFYHLVGDAAGYDAWAMRLMENGWSWPETFYQAPLYPYFLALIYKIFGHDLWTARVVQCVMGSAGCVGIGLAASAFCSRRAGLVAAAMMALYPPAIYFDGIIQKATLSFTLMAGLLWALSCGAKRPTRWRWLVVGVLLGLLALTRENALVLAPVVVGWLLLRLRGVDRWTSIALVAAGWTVALLPAVLHNYRVGGEIALTTFQMGPNFYMGNHENADGRYSPLVPGRETFEFERSDATTLAERAAGRELTPREVSSFWMDRSWYWIRSNPAEWARLLWTKWQITWNRYEIPDTESYYVSRDASTLLNGLGRVWHFGVLCPLAVCGVILTWDRRGELGILYAVAVALALSVTVFYVFGRYRYPLVPVLAILAAAGAVEIASALTRRERRQLFRAAIVALLAAVWVNWPVNPERQLNAAQLGNYGATLAAQGRLDDALTQFERSVAMNPDAPRVRQFLADALSFAGRFDEAIEHYQTALELEPRRPNADFNLAVALERVGRVDEAIAHYRRAVDINPRDAAAHAALIRLNTD